MLRMDERKIEQKKNRAETFRRIRMEAVFLISVILVYVLFYVLFSLVLHAVKFFIPLPEMIVFLIRCILFFITAGCTQMVVNSKGFNANMFSPKK